MLLQLDASLGNTGQAKQDSNSAARMFFLTKNTQITFKAELYGAEKKADWIKFTVLKKARSKIKL